MQQAFFLPQKEYPGILCEMFPSTFARKIQQRYHQTKSCWELLSVCHSMAIHSSGCQRLGGKTGPAPEATFSRGEKKSRVAGHAVGRSDPFKDPPFPKETCVESSCGFCQNLEDKGWLDLSWSFPQAGLLHSQLEVPQRTLGMRLWCGPLPFYWVTMSPAQDNRQQMQTFLALIASTDQVIQCLKARVSTVWLHRQPANHTDRAPTFNQCQAVLYKGCCIHSIHSFKKNSIIIKIYHLSNWSIYIQPK